MNQMAALRPVISPSQIIKSNEHFTPKTSGCLTPTLKKMGFLCKSIMTAIWRGISSRPDKKYSGREAREMSRSPPNIVERIP